MTHGPAIRIGVVVQIIGNRMALKCHETTLACGRLTRLRCTNESAEEWMRFRRLTLEFRVELASDKVEMVG